MARELKLKDYDYISSKSIIHNKKTLSTILNEKVTWHQLTNEIHYCEKNGVVFLYGESYGTKNLTVGDYTLVGTLPQNLRPTKRIMIASDLFGGGNCTGLIDEKGGIYIYTTVENASYWRLSGSFPL